MARVVDLEPGLYKALKAEGIAIPDNCIGLQLEMATDSIFVLRVTQTLTQDDIAKFGRVLATCGQKWT